MSVMLHAITTYFVKGWHPVHQLFVTIFKLCKVTSEQLKICRCFVRNVPEITSFFYAVPWEHVDQSKTWTGCAAGVISCWKSAVCWSWSLSQLPFGEKQGTPGMDRHSITESHRDKKPFTLTRRDSLESPRNLTYMFWMVGESWTCKLLTERPQLGFTPVVGLIIWLKVLHVNKVSLCKCIKQSSS